MTAGGEAWIVLPARRASSRLPGKLLLAESGRPLLAHTVERCLRSQVADRVLVAADGEELARVAREAGAGAVLTEPGLASGSDRVRAALEGHPEVRWVVNVQGDEPEIEPEAIDAVFGALAAGAGAVTLAAPWPEGVPLEDPDAVKVVRDLQGRALYFSRSPLPHPRGPLRAGAEPLLHIGVYGWAREVLETFAATPPTPLEQREGLEQLRLLETGQSVEVLLWPRHFPGIDTRADYDAFLARLPQPR